MELNWCGNIIDSVVFIVDHILNYIQGRDSQIFTPPPATLLCLLLPLLK